MPAVCRFYIKGYCRYGSSCRFEHPGESNYSTNEDDVGQASNFSFKSAINNIAPNWSSSFNAPNHNTTGTTGFSFSQAFQNTTQGSFFNAHDVDMSDNVAINQNQGQSSSIFSQAYNALQQRQQLPTQLNQPQVSSVHSPFSFQQQQQQQLYQQQSNSFGQNLSNNQGWVQPTQANSSPIVSTPAQQADKTLSSTFSDLQDLSEPEAKAFNSSKFEFRKIPVRPPPQALC